MAAYPKIDPATDPELRGLHADLEDLDGGPGEDQKVPRGRSAGGPGQDRFPVKAMKVTDGPFLENKEMVGGYVIVEASSLDEP